MLSVHSRLRACLAALLLLAGAALTVSGASAAEEKRALDPENTIYLELEHGRVVIAMRPDLAPNHVARIKELVRDGFYDGTPFHRVITGFMVQGGDPTGTGMGGSGQKLDAEFNSGKHVRGAVSMARAQNPDSADSQFFIVTADSNFLDGQYTMWGEVVEGMDAVDKIKVGQPPNGIVEDPDKIVRMQMMSDAEK